MNDNECISMDCSEFISVLNMNGVQMAVNITDISYVFRRNNSSYCTIVMRTNDYILETGSKYEDIINKLNIR